MTFTELLAQGIPEALLDTAKLIPFLFITYLVMEYLEHTGSHKLEDIVSRAGIAGPVFGAICGIVPQCGFSAASSSLYAGGLITVGTLEAIYLSTSDEMLPIMISEKISPVLIFKILLVKAVTAALFGMAIDLTHKGVTHIWKRQPHIHDICEQEHCHCEDGVVRSALRHTVKVTFFILLISIILELTIDVLGEEAIAGFILNRPMQAVMVCALVGLIPNCAASVVITQLYLDALIPASAMMAGLLTGAGVGMLVLFRMNRPVSKSLAILGILYVCGVAGGLLLQLTGLEHLIFG